MPRVVKKMAQTRTRVRFHVDGRIYFEKSIISPVLELTVPETLNGFRVLAPSLAKMSNVKLSFPCSLNTGGGRFTKIIMSVSI